MEYSTIKSPIDGIIVQSSVTTGETVNNSIQANIMIVVADNRKMIAEAQLSAEEIKDLKLGERLDLKVQGTTLSGAVNLLGQEAVIIEGKSQYKLNVRFENPGNLRQGQAVTILLP